MRGACVASSRESAPGRHVTTSRPSMDQSMVLKFVKVTSERLAGPAAVRDGEFRGEDNEDTAGDGLLLLETGRQPGPGVGASVCSGIASWTRRCQASSSVSSRTRCPSPPCLCRPPAPRRHCWVSGSVDSPGPHVGLVLGWERRETGCSRRRRTSSRTT
jgi:hypothetical protein